MRIAEYEISQNRAASRAAETVAAQRGQTRRFIRWCDAAGLSYLPATPVVVEEYLGSLAQRGLTVSTIGMALWAIDRMHKESHLPEPGAHADVKTAMAGIRRRFGAPQRQKRPLTIVQLGGFEYDDGLDGFRDRAALLVGSAACLRISELMVLRRANLTASESGMQLFIRHSKTDRFGVGQRVDVPRSTRHPNCCPVTAMEAWLKAGRPDGWLFPRSMGKGPCTRRHWTNLIKALVTRAGLDPHHYGTHSLRAGGATYLASLGVHAADIARHGRWESADMVFRYVRTDLSKALANLY